MANRVSERFVPLNNGSSVLEGVQSVGISQGYVFSDVYSYPRNGFPKTEPANRKGGKELFWANVSANHAK